MKNDKLKIYLNFDSKIPIPFNTVAGDNYFRIDFYLFFPILFNVALYKTVINLNVSFQKFSRRY